MIVTKNPKMPYQGTATHFAFLLFIFHKVKPSLVYAKLGKKNLTCPINLHRCKLQVQVEDSSGSTTFVIFDREAEHLLGIPTIFLLEKREDTASNCPPILKKIEEKQFIFQIRLNDYNLKERFENYTVHKIFVPNEQLEEYSRINILVC